MKMKKLMALILTVVMILSIPTTGFSASSVSESPYSAILFDADFDEYTASYTNTTAATHLYGDLSVSNYSKSAYDLNLTPEERDGGKAIRYSAVATEDTTKTSEPQLVWYNSSSYIANLISIEYDMDFTDDTSKTGMIYDLEMKVSKDGDFIYGENGFSFVRENDGLVYPYICGKKIPSASAIADGWHTHKFLLNTVTKTLSLYIDGNFVAVSDEYTYDFSSGVEAVRFASLGSKGFAFDNLKVSIAESAFITTCDDAMFKVGDTITVDALIAEDFDTAAMYIGGVKLAETTAAIDGKVYRFNAGIVSEVPFGTNKVELVITKDSQKTVLDSFDVEIIGKNSAITENAFTFDNLTLDEGTALTTTNTGLSTLSASAVTLSKSQIGTNSTNKLNITASTSGTSVGSIDYLLSTAVGGVHEVEFDWYPTTASSYIGVEMRANNYHYVWPSNKSAAFHFIQKGIGLDADYGVSANNWYHILVRTYLDDIDRYEVYINGELRHSNIITLISGKSATLSGLRIKPRSDCYIDNIYARHYTPIQTSGAISAFDVASNSYTASGASIPTASSALSAQLSCNITTQTAPYLRDASGIAVSGAAVAVSGSKVDVTLTTALAGGKYAIVIPADATYASGNTLGSVLEIPFEATDDFILLSPVSGASVDSADGLTVNTYVPDLAKPVTVMVDDTTVETVTADNKFWTYQLQTADFALGSHTLTLVYDGEKYSTTFITEHVVKSDIVAFTNYETDPGFTFSVQNGGGSAVVNTIVDFTDRGKVGAIFDGYTTTSKNTAFTQFFNETITDNIVVIQEDVYFEDASDQYWYECNYNIDVSLRNDLYTDEACTTKATSIRAQYYAGNGNGILDSGSIQGEVDISDNTWYTLTTVFDFNTAMSYIYVGSTCVVSAPITYAALAGGPYYYKGSGDSTAIQLDASNAETYLGKINGITYPRAYSKRVSSHNAITHTYSAYSTSYLCLLRDNLHIYTQHATPNIVTAPKNLEEGANTIEVTFDSAYSTTDIAAKEDIEFYVDGVKTNYALARISSNTVTITLNEAIDAHKILNIKFLPTLMLAGDTVASGALNEVTVYTTRDGIYINSDLEKGTKANAAIECKNFGDLTGNAYIVLAVKNAVNELTACDIATPDITDGFTTTLEADMTNAVTANLIVWKDMTPLCDIKIK